MIRVEGLHKSFDGVHVLRGVELWLARGKLLALVGISGQGKSVLLKHLAGLMRPDRGRVFVDGLEVTRLRGRGLERLRARLGFLFQGGALFDSMSLYDNVAFPLREKLRLPEAECDRRVLAALDQVGLTGAGGRYPAQLSGGMAKRAALARALVAEPEIMLFDEPTTGLDPIINNAMLKLIGDCHRRQGFTGIIVSHAIPQVFTIVDKVALLHNGVIRCLATPAEVEASNDPVVRQFVRSDIQGPVQVL